MYEMKCPYCSETRPSRSRLMLHVDGVHLQIKARDGRVHDVMSARPVEDVTGPKLPEEVSYKHLSVTTDERGDTRSHYGRLSDCLSCGPYISDDEDAVDTRIAALLNRSGENLAKMKDDLSTMRTALDRIDIRMELTQTIRAQTMAHIMCELSNAGMTDASDFVNRMLGDMS